MRIARGLYVPCLIALVVALLPWPGLAHKGGNCSKLLTSENRSDDGQEIKSPDDHFYAKVEEQFKQLQTIPEHLLSQRQKKTMAKVAKSLPHRLNEFKSLPASEKKSHLLALLEKWKQAMERRTDLIHGYEACDKGLQQFCLEILQASLSTLAVHIPHMLETASVQSTDFARFHHILDETRLFQETSPAVSFYKIKRTITARFSLQEYTQCRVK